MSGPPIFRLLDLQHERGRYPILTDNDQWLGYLVIAAQLEDASYATANLLNQPHAVERAKQEWVPRDAFCAQLLFTYPGRQTTRSHDFQPVTKDVDLRIHCRSVVSMSDSVDQRARQCIFREFQPFVPSPCA